MKVSSFQVIFVASIALLLSGGFHEDGVGLVAGLPVFWGVLCTIVGTFSVQSLVDCLRTQYTRRLSVSAIEGGDDPTHEEWMDAKESCSKVEYDMKVVVHTELGHVMLLATPNDVLGVCTDQVLMHTAYKTEQDEKDGIFSFLTHTIPQEKDLSEDLATYDLHVTLTFEVFANGLETIDYDPSTTYKDVPMNCITYLLELGKYWNIPIEADMVEFVMNHVKASKFMETFTTNDAYKMLGQETWFGSTQRRKLGTDPNTMLERLVDYMFEEQYPQDLLHL